MSSRHPRLLLRKSIPFFALCTLRFIFSFLVQNDTKKAKKGHIYWPKLKWK